MSDDDTRQRSWLKWILIGAGWTLFALFFSGEMVVSRAYFGRPLLFICWPRERSTK